MVSAQSGPRIQPKYETLLRERFRLQEFRTGQLEIIEAVLAGKDVLAVLPTGGGKSLCFQFPAVLRESLVVVISPLIALMRDQVANLQRQGIPAGCLHSGQLESEKRSVFQQIAAGGAFILYLSPERAQKEGFQKWIMSRPIAAFAIDEAHCVSKWGHDFREEYAQLGILKKLRPEVPVLALTASATPLVLNDISRNLALQNPERHVHGFYRKNLYYQVETCADESEKFALLAQGLVQNPGGRVIVYCGTRAATEAISKDLSARFSAVGFYHAGLAAEERTRVQQAYGSGEIRILVATNAFGMGIDHPDVRLVVHFHMPANIDSLYQEMGRAGRDGADSTCLLLYSRKDKGLQSFFIQGSGAPPEIKRSRWNTLDALIAYASGGECRHAEILTYYKDSKRISNCGHCDACAPESKRRIQRGEAHESPLAAKSSKKTRKAQTGGAELVAFEGLSEEQKQRFSLLKDWRRRKAAELDMAAFMVFSDQTLRQIAFRFPKSTEDLRGVHGIGEVKLEQFGRELMELLKFM